MNVAQLLRVLAAAGGMCAAGYACAASYTFTDLAPGSVNGKAASINNAGQIVGALDGSAVVWNSGKPTTLQSADPAGGSFAFGINNSGVAVGAQFGSAGMGKASRWDAQGGATELPSGVFAYGINDQGQIVGSTKVDIFAPSNAALWSNGNLVQLNSPFGQTNNSVAVAINNKGVAVGSAVDNNNVAYQAVVWRDGQGALLSNLGGFYTYANAINDDGVIVGSSSTTDGVTHAVMWAGGQLTTLQSEGDYAQASGINVRGQVVGLSNAAKGANSRATLWENGREIDLTTYLDPVLAAQGWHMYSATGINDAGVIVGYLEKQGQYKAFMLTPSVPEPQQYAMMVGGLVTLGWLFRRGNAVAAR